MNLPKEILNNLPTITQKEFDAVILDSVVSFVIEVTLKRKNHDVKAFFFHIVSFYEGFCLGKQWTPNEGVIKRIQNILCSTGVVAKSPAKSSCN